MVDKPTSPFAGLDKALLRSTKPTLLLCLRNLRNGQRTLERMIP
jgi:hypothetical protein